MNVQGSIAYTAQEAWVFAGTVRENITFGRDFNIDWYDKVVDACALRRDFEIFPYGDSTLVGDRGASLSGGQKARITLARLDLLTKKKMYIHCKANCIIDSKSKTNHL